MERPASPNRALRAAQTLSSLPVRLGFVVGSLPVLAPLALYRWLARTRR